MRTVLQVGKKKLLSLDYTLTAVFTTSKKKNKTKIKTKPGLTDWTFDTLNLWHHLMQSQGVNASLTCRRKLFVSPSSCTVTGLKYLFAKLIL